MLNANLDAKLINIKSYKFVNECLPVPISEAEGLYFAYEVKIKATNSTEPMKQMFEKARNAFIAGSNSSIEDIALSLPRFNQIKKTLYHKKHQDMPILPHCFLPQEMHACGFVLMPDRLKKSYVQVCKALRDNSTGYTMNPALILSDFEIGAMNAFKEVFPKTIIKGCHFHFTQAIWRNIQKNGLCAWYKENKIIRDWLSLFGALEFIPLEQLDTAWDLILAH